jgi:tRNA(Ile)-lysidine synthase
MVFAVAQLPSELRHRVRLIHVHHGLMADADAWVALCERNAERLNLHLSVLRVQVRTGGQGLESAARQARYQALFAALAPDEVLLTAQHLDDQAETLLIQLLRGAGLDGLAAMAGERARLLRPWLTCSRDSIRSLLPAGFEIVTDASNSDQRLERAWLRSSVLPPLTARWPALVRTLADTAARMAADRALLDMTITSVLANVRTLDPAVIRFEALAKQPAAIRLRVLKSFIEEVAHKVPPAAMLERIDHEFFSLRADAEPEWRHGKLRLLRFGELLGVKSVPPALAETALIRGAQHFPGRGSLSLAFEPPSTWRASARQGGERIHLGGMRRELRKLLQELAVPGWERDRLVLIWDADRPGECLAILGLACSDTMTPWLAEHGHRLQWSPSEQTIEHAVLQDIDHGH